MDQQKQAVWVSLASLTADITPLAAEEFHILEEMLGVLAPFHQATVELSEQKRVSGSNVIPLLKILYLALQRKASNVVTWTAKQLIENLQRVTDILFNLETLSMMTFAKLLDPRFKCLGFLSSSKSQ